MKELQIKREAEISKLKKEKESINRDKDKIWKEWNNDKEKICEMQAEASKKEIDNLDLKNRDKKKKILSYLKRRKNIAQQIKIRLECKSYMMITKSNYIN